MIAKSARENTKDAYEASARSVRLSSKIHRFKAMMVPVLFQNIYIPGTGGNVYYILAEMNHIDINDTEWSIFETVWSVYMEP